MPSSIRRHLPIAISLATLVVGILFASLRVPEINGLTVHFENVPNDDSYSIYFNTGDGFQEHLSDKVWVRSLAEDVALRFSFPVPASKVKQIRFDLGNKDDIYRIRGVSFTHVFLLVPITLSQWDGETLAKVARDPHAIEKMVPDNGVLTVLTSGNDPYFSASFEQAALLATTRPGTLLLLRAVWLLPFILLAVMTYRYDLIQQLVASQRGWPDRTWAGVRATEFAVRNWRPKARRSIGWLLVAVVYAFFVQHALRRGFDHDELEAVHTAWLMLKGQKIYVDFFQHHNPGYYLILMPVISIFGEHWQTLISARLVSIFVVAGTVVAIYLFTLRIYGRSVALLSVAVLGCSGLFVNSAVEARPDVLMTALSTLAFFLIAHPRLERWRWAYVVSGVLVGAAFVILQKAVLVAFAIGVILIIRLVLKRIRLVELVAWGAGFIGVVGVFVGWLLSAGVWEEYWFLNWQLNSAWIARIDKFEYTYNIVAANPGMWLTAAVGAMMSLNRPQGREIAIVGVVLLGLVLTAPNPFDQYYLMVLPFIGILAAYGMIRLSFGSYLVLAGLMAAVLMYPFYYTLFNKYEYKFQAHQREQIQYVLSVTGPNDVVYDGNSYFNVFRRDLDYFWFSTGSGDALGTWREFRPYEYDMRHLIETKKPKVVNRYHMPEEVRAWLKRDYERSEKFPDLWVRCDGPCR